VEHAAWFFYRLRNNEVGYYSYPALVFVVLLANINRTITRLLILLISMGLGVVKWTLGTTRVKIGFLVIFYLFFSFLFQLSAEITTLAKKEVLLPAVSMAIIIPSALLDTLFYYWIIFSLIRTIQQLTLRRQSLKLDMYKQFLAVLVFVGICELSLMLFRAYTRFAERPIGWQYTWLLDTYREILYFIVITAIGYLWRPRANNIRYGYKEFFEDDDVPIPVVATDIQVAVNPGDNQELTTFDKQILSIDLPEEDDNPSLETELKKMD